VNNIQTKLTMLEKKYLIPNSLVFAPRTQTIKTTPPHKKQENPCQPQKRKNGTNIILNGSAPF
jgi:hypothetical protein